MIRSTASMDLLIKLSVFCEDFIFRVDMNETVNPQLPDVVFIESMNSYTLFNFQREKPCDVV
jgi:hypothetical protein